MFHANGVVFSILPFIQDEYPYLECVLFNNYENDAKISIKGKYTVHQQFGSYNQTFWFHADVPGGQESTAVIPHSIDSAMAGRTVKLSAQATTKWPNRKGRKLHNHKGANVRAAGLSLLDMLSLPLLGFGVFVVSSDAQSQISFPDEYWINHPD